MQNNSLCVEEPFNTSRNLGNTADEATIKGLQLEFRRAVHYLADHNSLEVACWPYQFPTPENPRPERHLPNLPPQYRSTTTNTWKKTKYFRPQNSSPPFKSPKPRAEDLRNFNSFGGSRPHYPFNPLNLNSQLPQQIPIPTTPQSMSGNMSAAGDMHNAYPPTPIDQIHYIDPFKNPQVAYYIRAFSANGLPLYVPYTEDPVVYASPPQTPAMSETSLSHQPQYPRMQPYVFPQQYSRGQSVQRGRQPHREEDVVSPTSTFRDQPLTEIEITTPGISTISPTYIPPPMKRRNSLPPNNKPNVPVHSTSSTPESYTPSSSSLSQGLAGSMSSVGGSDVFEEEFFDGRYAEESPAITETPRPAVNGSGKSNSGKSPGTAKESPGLPAGKSYAAALLNAAPAKSPTQPPVKRDTLPPLVTIPEKEKMKAGSVKSPSINVTNSPTMTFQRDEAPASSPIASPIDHRRGSTVWNNTLHPSSAETTPISPTNVIQARRPSVHSITSNSPKKLNRLGSNTKSESRKGSIISIPEPVEVPATPTPGKKRRKAKNNKKKESVNSNTNANGATINGTLNRRQSVISIT